jgi:hypothetical protein
MAGLSLVDVRVDDHPAPRSLLAHRLIAPKCLSARLD